MAVLWADRTVFDDSREQTFKIGREYRILGAICSQCHCLFSDNAWDGLYICMTCDRRLIPRDPQGPDALSRFHQRLVMSGRQLERKMLGQR